ncbi:TBC-domain-containing protein [Ramicandelaber brevisporus]|nr:TBC-domain-containing protein [Ramicandelaber brevisporus]
MEFLLNQIERQNQLLAQDPRAQGYDQEYRERYRMSLDKAHARAIMDGVEDGINWEFWGMLINDYDNMVKKHGRLVTQHIHEGIPESIRGAMWQNIAQSKDSDLEERYAELLGQEAAPQHDKLIKSDVPRTFSSMELFRERGGPGQERMYNVLKAYSLYDPEVGYCQGLSFIAAALLIYMPDEEAFCLMVRLMFAYDLRGHFTPDMYKLHLRLYQLDKLVEELLPAVHRHFILEGIRPTMFASQWFMTLFAYRFPLSLVARILDIVLAEGVESIFRFALALLRANQQAILEHTFDNLLAFVNHSIFDVYSHDPSQFVRDADEIHIVTAKRLAKYADEYEKQRQREEREKDVLVQLRNQNTQLDQSNKSLQNTLQQLNQEHCDLASQFVQLKLELQRERELSEQRAQKITDLESKLQGERQAAEDALKSDMEALANKNLELAQRTNDLEDLVHITQDELIGVKLKYAESEDQREQLQRKFSELRRTFGDV